MGESHFGKKKESQSNSMEQRVVLTLKEGGSKEKSEGKQKETSLGKKEKSGAGEWMQRLSRRT